MLHGVVVRNRSDVNRIHLLLSIQNEHAQVPVVPVGIVGTTGDFWQRAKRGLRPKLEMRIGKPIHFSPMTEKGNDRREARQRNADLVMRYIAGLLPKEYHGVYAGQAIS